MSVFPFFVELEGKRCLVIGGGRVARRKAQALLPFGAEVTLVAPEIDKALKGLPGVALWQRPFREGDLEGFDFVIAASDDPHVNARAAELCHARRIPVNRADERDGFLFPALIRRGALTVGICTGGSSPAAAGYFRRLLEAALPEKTGEILDYLRRTRETLKARLPQGQERTELLRSLAGESLRKGAPLTAAEEHILEESGPRGRVYLVGAGCGRADLITVRGLRLIQTCDALIYDELIDKSLLDAAPAHAEKIPMGKRAGGKSARQEDIIEAMISLARSGKTVVRLKGGDPYLFGRGGEELLSLRQAGIGCQEVPGIPSAIGIPAEFDIPVTYRQVSRSLHIITAHTAQGVVDLEKYAQLEGTLVFLMGLNHLEAITQGLIRYGKDAMTPAALLSGGNAPAKQCIRGTLQTLPALAKDAQAPAIILVGEVAELGLVFPGDLW